MTALVMVEVLFRPEGGEGWGGGGVECPVCMNLCLFMLERFKYF